MLARTPNPGDDDGADGVDVFWPLLVLAVLSAGWAGFCFYLRGHVTDPGVIKGMTIMGSLSAGSVLLWLVLAWVMRPRRS
jgi:hypothetical protein